MQTLDLELRVNNIVVVPANSGAIDICFKARKEDVLNHFEVQDVLDHFGMDDLLRWMDDEQVKAYYGWE